jgi:hypothetical protein
MFAKEVKTLENRIIVLLCGTTLLFVLSFAAGNTNETLVGVAVKASCFIVVYIVFVYAGDIIKTSSNSLYQDIIHLTYGITFVLIILTLFCIVVEKPLGSGTLDIICIIFHCLSMICISMYNKFYNMTCSSNERVSILESLKRLAARKVFE